MRSEESPQTHLVGSALVLRVLARIAIKGAAGGSAGLEQSEFSVPGQIKIPCATQLAGSAHCLQRKPNYAAKLCRDRAASSCKSADCGPEIKSFMRSDQPLDLFIAIEL